MVAHLSPPPPIRRASLPRTSATRQFLAIIRTIVCWTLASATLLAIGQRSSNVACAAEGQSGRRAGAQTTSTAEQQPASAAEDQEDAAAADPYILSLPQVRPKPRLTAADTTIETAPAPRWDGGLTPPKVNLTKNNTPPPIVTTTGVIRLQSATQRGEPLPMPEINAPKDQTTNPLGLRPIGQITTNIAPPRGPLPGDRSGVLVVSPINPWAVARGNSLVQYQWEAPVVCHGPLYFDDVPLEHFGQSPCPWLQPALSAVRFTGNVIILPYKMALDHPRTPTYTLREYPRPDRRLPACTTPSRSSSSRHWLRRPSCWRSSSSFRDDLAASPAAQA